MYKWDEISNVLPPMLSGNELKEKLLVLPEYDEDIRACSQAERLIALNDIYDVYLPSQMSCEIYGKIYLAILRSMQKKVGKDAIRQKYANHRAMRTGEYSGIIGGMDCFSVIGYPGCGKSTAIARALEVSTANQVIEMENPYCKIIPALTIQVPHDCSIKSLLLQILSRVDGELGSDYYNMAIRSKATTDILISVVSNVANNNLSLLILDEMQHISYSKFGRQLAGAMTQLINSSGISICMVATPEVEPFLQSTDYFARRALGLRYEKLEYGNYFIQLCKTLLHYSYVKEEAEVSEKIFQTLYEYSGGSVASVVFLIHDAQEISIMNGREKLDTTAISDAYKNRMGMLQDKINMEIEQRRRARRRYLGNKVLPIEAIKTNDANKGELEKQNDFGTDWSIVDLVVASKKEGGDIVKTLQERIKVIEVDL